MRRKSKKIQPIDEHCTTHERDHVRVTVRTHEVMHRTHPRFEISLEGDGERAVVDVFALDAELEQRIEQAVDAFLASMSLRGAT